MNFFGISPMQLFQIAAVVATGGAAAPVMLQQMAMKVAVQMAIQKIGQELGLPPQVISMAQNLAMSQMGGPSVDFSNAANNPLNFVGSNEDFMSMFAPQSPSELGAFNRDFSDFYSASSGLARGFDRQETGLRSQANALDDQALAARAAGNTRQAEMLEAQAEQIQNQLHSLDEMLNNLQLNSDLKKLEREIKEKVGDKKMSIIMRLALVLGSGPIKCLPEG